MSLPFEQTKQEKPYNHLKRCREDFSQISTPNHHRISSQTLTQRNFLKLMKGINKKPRAVILKDFLLKLWTKQGGLLSLLPFNRSLDDPSLNDPSEINTRKIKGKKLKSQRSFQTVAKTTKWILTRSQDTRSACKNLL